MSGDGEPERQEGSDDSDVARLRAELAAAQVGMHRLRSLIDSAHDYALIATDLEDRVTDWSMGAQRAFGWTESEMLGRPAADIFLPTDVADGSVRRVMRNAVEQGRCTDERWHIRKSGARFWASNETTALRDTGGTVVGFAHVLRDRTNQRRLRSRLAESQDRYRTLFETIGAGFCIIEMRFDAAARPVDFLYLETNPEFERQTGLSDVVGKLVSEVIPDLEPRRFEIYGRVARTGDPARFVEGALTLGRWFDVSAHRVGDADAHQVAVLFTDVTQERHAEEALRESDEQFRVFAQAMPNHVWAGTADGSLYWFNEKVYQYSGARRTDLEGSKWAGIVHPDDIGHAAEVWTACLAVGEIYETEFRIRRADGAYRWFLVRALPVRDAQGTVVRWVGTNTDIDEHKRTLAEVERLNTTLEEEVEARTRERNRLWETTNDLMGTAGLDGYLKAVNPAWSRMLGWSDTELLGRPFLEIVDPEDHAATGVVVGQLAAGQRVVDFIDRVLDNRGGQRTIMWTAVPEAPLFYIVGRDLTDQRKTEEALRQSQKMEAVGQLTGGIAHDFNNLLTGITGSLELLETRVAQGRFKDVDRYISAAQGAAKRAAALTHRLLAFSRRQTLDPTPTDINRLLAGIEDLIRRTVGPSIEIEVVGAGGLWPALVDPNQLENALLNLCINARDAMPDGGRITIETANKWLDDHGARDRDLLPGQYLSICVTDTGTGMTPEVIARAFDPFFTTKPLGQGTGLGLSMIYGFARQSGGQVRIYSELGQGTTMCIYLPRHNGPIADAGDAHDLTHASRAEQGETVLVVDDEPTVRMLVTDVLEDLGYTAIEAADGASGLKVLQSDVRIDLLVTDVGLPGGMNGRQVADAARMLRPDLKVLFITGYAENAAVGNGHLDHGMHLLTKPFAMETLASRIRELITGARI